jgi:hypothetical protein
MSAYIKKIERSQINDLMIHLKLLEKQEQANPSLIGERTLFWLVGCSFGGFCFIWGSLGG